MRDPGRSWRRTTRAWLLVVAGLSALGFVLLSDMAEDQHFPGIDLTVRALVQWERKPALERPMRLISRVGSGYVLIPLNAVILLLLSRRDRRLALFVPLTTMGAVVLEGVAKWAVARPRPNLTAYGFPSGHTLASVVFFGALTYVLWTTTARPLWRGVGTLGCALVVLGIAYSRLYLDAHWLTDVLGGVLGGTAYLLVMIAAFELRRRTAGRTPPTCRSSSPRSSTGSSM